VDFRNITTGFGTPIEGDLLVAHDEGKLKKPEGKQKWLCKTRKRNIEGMEKELKATYDSLSV